MRDLIASLFQGGFISDPRLAGVTVTAVKLTGDLQICYVYYRLYDESQLKAAQKALEHASGLLRKRLADGLKVRKVPDLKFVFDKSVEEGAQIESLLERIRNEG